MPVKYIKGGTQNAQNSVIKKFLQRLESRSRSDTIMKYILLVSAMDFYFLGLRKILKRLKSEHILNFKSSEVESLEEDEVERIF